MSTSRSRNSRVFTVSFPESLAKQVEKVAREESRNISELFREAFRVYRLEQVRRRLDQDNAYARSRNQTQYTEEEIARFVDEVRAENFARGKQSA
jgi:metal-responsive CopG/Arc/MetJ family transcriptional regulator